MRGPRSLLVLLVLALGVGAYAYFVESKKDLTDPSTKRDKVFKVETGKIDDVEVHAVSGDVTKLKKTGDEWQIVAPVTVTADQSTANSLVSTLETLEMQKTLDENPASVSAFGLEPARFTVAFRTAGDTTLHKLN